MSLASSVGLTSGIDYETLISQTRSVNSAPIYSAQSKISTFQNKAKALSSVQGYLSKLKSAAEALSNKDAFFNMSVGSTLTSSVTASADDDAEEGSYTVKVNQLAQAHRIASQGVATSTNDSIASTTGTLEFKVGDGATTTIDVTAGMTLQELVDEINNDSSSKVRASIVNDGSVTNPYRLVLSAKETGAANKITFLNNDTDLNLTSPSSEAPVASTSNTFDGTVSTGGTYTGTTSKTIVLEIVEGGAVGTAKFKVSYDGGVTFDEDNLLTASQAGADLGEGMLFYFNAGTTDLAVGDSFSFDVFSPELQKAQDAKMTVDGIQVSRSTNKFEDVIDGVTLTAKAVDEDSSTITVSKSTGSVQELLNNLVTAYNSAFAGINSLMAYNVDTQESEILFGDTGVQAIVNSMRTEMNRMVPGLDSDLNTLAQLGISVDSDGVLSLDSTEFSEVLKDDPEGVMRLFAEWGKSSNSLVEYVSSTEDTDIGQYSVNITQAATQAAVKGDNLIGSSGLTASETITIALNEQAVSVSLSAGQTIGSIVETINQALADEGIDAVASNEDGYLQIKSTEYGSDYKLSVFSTRDAAEAGQLGIGKTSRTDTGLDVEGTINGVSAKGTGQILKGADGTIMEGLKLKITSGVPTTATVNLTQGIAMRLMNQLESFMDDENGLFVSRQDSYNDQIQDLNDQISDLNDRLDAQEELMRSQFTSLETKLSQIQTQGDFLLSQLSSMLY